MQWQWYDFLHEARLTPITRATPQNMYNAFFITTGFESSEFSLFIFEQEMI
jgi:hypothetical protein